ncbi:hypothetical protein GH714_029579 [Hevea brasiliensis]|uniref:Protein kinase domain-containing protein n=1 Tax=Hevea brasiliensis TaxID=3981 RepID=A0A6A6NCP6_HEVBR|nr:hypothetical protein GH714_029579 [Hevea brasiliensis]
MPAEEEAQAFERRNVLVGIRIDKHSRELLNWALVKVAEPGDSVIAVHVCRSSRAALKDKPSLDSYLEVYDGLCSLKKVDLIGQVSTGISVQRTLVREAKIHNAVALVVGTNNQSTLGSWTSTAGYCAKRLPPTTDVLAVHNGKILFGRCNNNQLPGFRGDPKPSLNLHESPLSDDVRSEFGDSEVDTVTSSFEVLTRCESEDSKDEVPSLPHELKKRPTAHFTGDILDQRPGWPLLRRASSASPGTLQARGLSVVQWALSLPIRWPHKNSLGNLIGKGECNCVYKGILPDGKSVAVKIRKSSPVARKDFAQEVEIISSVNHKNIMPLVGVCIRDTDLISVYDLFSKGSLEENLYGKTSLSDFGLAIWGPTTSSFMTQSDVVGTFGYLAPEYFMYGKVSDKIDVYAYGVILLELLSGRRPIAYETLNDQKSLVMWAKPMLDSGKARDIIDPNLEENFDEAQIQRMVLAAKLCITRSARLRPKMIEVLKLLIGDKDALTWANVQNEDLDDNENQEANDDEVYPNYSAELHLNLALLDLDDDSISFSSVEQGNSISMEEYLKDRWSRSSSFN